MLNLCKKLRKTLRKSMWGNGGMFYTFLHKYSNYCVAMWTMFGFHKIISKFYNAFYTEFLFGYNLLRGYFYTFST